jgi:lysophospholipase L1-like esterase
MFRRFRLIALALPVVAGCYTNETLDPPDLSNNNGLFTRFVAIGTSISAGLQSAGINDSTQRRAFPVLVAEQAGASFSRPSLNLPGCPAPFTNNVTQARVGGATASGCTLRQTPIPYHLGNLAAPGLSTPDLFTNVGSPISTYERLQIFFLGGQTPWNAVKAAQPTLLSIEIGSNDVLGAVTSAPNPGDPDSVTPYPVFADNYTKFADSVATLNTKVVAFTIPDVTLIPYTSRGSTYWCLKTGACGFPAQFPPTVTVDNNCAPNAAIPGSKGDSVLVPWTIGVAGLLRASSPPFTPFALDCSNTLQVVTPAEYAYVRNTTDQMNQLIRDQAALHGWALVDVSQILTQLQVQDGGIPAFPSLAAVPTGGSINFGNWFSLDGFHPSSATHRVVADSTIAVVNRFFTTEIPAVP